MSQVARELFNECLHLFCGVSLSRYRTALEGDGPPSRKHALSRAAVFREARMSRLATKILQSGAKAALIVTLDEAHVTTIADPGLSTINYNRRLVSTTTL